MFTSVLKLTVENKYRIFPNPVGNQLFIELPDRNFTFKLYDFHGREVLVKTIYGNKESLNTSILKSGVYIYTIEKEGDLYTGKLIKK